MTITEIRQKLLASDEFVIAELQKVQTLYALKRVIRYNHTREHDVHTESVAEHVFGMHCLVDYFLPLEDLEGEWQRSKIHSMIQYHDIDEIITGDTIGYLKSEQAHLGERLIQEKVIVTLPEIMQQYVREVTDEYEEQLSMESRFAKAIDKTEPIFHLYNQTGKTTLAVNQTTKDQNDRIKLPYVLDFPILKRFTEVMSKQFEKEGFFHE